MRQVQKVGKFFLKIKKYSELCGSAKVRKATGKRPIARRHTKEGKNYLSQHDARST